MAVRVALDDVTCRYGSVTAVESVSLTVPSGGSLAVLGPSGSGKSTLLRAIAGFAVPAAGSVRLGERVVTDERVFVPPEQRRIGLVHQQYALWPNMTVRDHLLYPLRLRGIAAGEQTRIATELLEALQLADVAGRRVTRLSGGQQQRVALARALACDPDVLLLDEPTSALDAQLRESALAAIRAVRLRTGVTVVFVTHDFREALALGDEMALLDRGRLLQHGPVREVYDGPSQVRAAELLGYENRLRVRVLRRAAGHVLVALPHAEPHSIEAPCPGVLPAGEAILAFRPGDTVLCAAGSQPSGLQGTVEALLDQGENTRYLVRWAGCDGLLVVSATGAPRFAEGTAVGVQLQRTVALPM